MANKKDDQEEDEKKDEAPQPTGTCNRCGRKVYDGSTICASCLAEQVGLG